MTRTAQVLAACVVMVLTAGCSRITGDDDKDDASWPDFVSLSIESSIEVPDDAATAAGEDDATCPDGITIGFVGALSGPAAPTGRSVSRSVQLAITQHNDANPKCQVEFAAFDTKGSPRTAASQVKRAIDDESVVGVVGPLSAAELGATGDLFEKADLVQITPSATSTELARKGWKTFFRAVGNDAAQGPAAAVLAKKLGAKSVYVIREDSDYGRDMGKTAAEALGAMLVGQDQVEPGQATYASTIAKILTSKAHAVYFVSSDPVDGARLARQLKARQFQGRLIGSDQLRSRAFIARAGSAADDTYFTCLCTPGELIPPFAKEYENAFDVQPGPSAVEAYDAAIVLLKGIDGGDTEREDMTNFVGSYVGQGYATSYHWSADGELVRPRMYGYKVDEGRIRPVGTLK